MYFVRQIAFKKDPYYINLGIEGCVNTNAENLKEHLAHDQTCTGHQ